jgi:hypothetical protein
MAATQIAAGFSQDRQHVTLKGNGRLDDFGPDCGSFSQHQPRENAQDAEKDSGPQVVHEQEEGGFKKGSSAKVTRRAKGDFLGLRLSDWRKVSSESRF